MPDPMTEKMIDDDRERERLRDGLDDQDVRDLRNALDQPPVADTLPIYTVRVYRPLLEAVVKELEEAREEKPEVTWREKGDSREALLAAALTCIGDRIDEQPADPGWSAELHDEHLLIAARKYVRLHEGVEVVGG